MKPEREYSGGPSFMLSIEASVAKERAKAELSMVQTDADGRRILILGLDTFAKKNTVQIKCLEAEGCSFVVLTNDQRGNSAETFNAQSYVRSRLTVAPPGAMRRLRVALALLTRQRFDHVELYAAGRMAILYLLLLKLLRQKYAVVERGDIGCLSDYGLIVRLAIKLAYRWAAGVIYKETYMEEPLRAATKAPLFFVPNCVDEPPVARVRDEASRDIDYLWVNRIVPQRRPAWLLSAARGPLSGRSITMLGFEERANLPPIIQREQERMREVGAQNVTLLGFIDPEPFYRRASFFCLPAEVVFGNNSLLEAMSWGVVPIVTKAPGVELIVRDGVNGIVTEFSEHAFHDGLARAARLGATEWQRLSDEAAATVRDEYSTSAWTQRMIAVYRRLAA